MADLRSVARALKWVWRAITIFWLIALAISVPLFLNWEAHHARELAAGSHVVATKRGDIEVAVSGSGTPYLPLHGSPGGYDQVLPGSSAAPAIMQTIAVSRPGYLRTPLSSGRTPQEQADLFAALLDELHVERVVVQGSSGGADSAIQFALRHPDRTMGLILYAPALGSHADKFGSGSKFEDFANWVATTPLLVRLIGAKLARDFNPSDPTQRAAFIRAVRTKDPSNLHKAGRSNDHEQAANPAIDNWPVESIQAPTLIIHGDADKNTSYPRSVALASRIPGARLVTIRGGDHLAFVTRTEEVRRAIDEFVAELPRPGDPHQSASLSSRQR